MIPTGVFRPVGDPWVRRFVRHWRAVHELSSAMGTSEEQRQRTLDRITDDLIRLKQGEVR